MRITALFTGTIALVTLLACGGGGGEEPAVAENGTAEPAPTTAAPAGLTTPEWMTVDGQNVTLDIVAGGTEENNRWNYNGLYAGTGEIVVPQGATVTINFENGDPNQPHSVGIGAAEATYPAVFESATPAFDGAMSSNPTTTGTPTGESESFSFVAGAPGEYAMICYIPGHAVAGMVVTFTVSADGSAGVR